MSGRVAWSCFNPWHGHACYCRPAPTPSASLLHGILFDDPGRPNNNRTAGPITNSARAVTLWRDEIAGPILPGCRDDRRIPPRPGVTDGARRSFSHCIAPASAFLRTKSRGLPSWTMHAGRAPPSGVERGRLFLPPPSPADAMILARIRRMAPSVVRVACNPLARTPSSIRGRPSHASWASGPASALARKILARGFST